MICIKGQYHVEKKAESNWEGNEVQMPVMQKFVTKPPETTYKV